MKRKKTKKRLILLIALAFLLVLGILFLIKNELSDRQDTQEIPISTPYCTLYFPSVWKDMLRLEQTELVGEDSLIVAFYGKLDGREEQHIFDICIHSKEAEGTRHTVSCVDGKKRYISTVLYSLNLGESWTDADKNMIYAMQEDVNYLLGKLSLMNETELLPEGTDGTQPVMTDAPEYEAVIVDTPYGTMYYPGDWSQYLKIERVEGEKYTVNFYASIVPHQELLLFSISFTEADQDTVWIRTLDDGSVVGVDVVFYTLQFDGWNEEQKNLVLIMQEAGNDLLHQLNLVETERSPEEETKPAETIDPDKETDREDDIVIETPYGELRYPQKWQDAIRVEKEATQTLVVSFYAKIGEHEDQLLFSVLFDADEGTMVGAVTDRKGDLVSVSLVFGELSNPNEWTEPERDTFYSMQEDANYLVESLKLV